MKEFLLLDYSSQDDSDVRRKIQWIALFTLQNENFFIINEYSIYNRALSDV